MWICWARRRNRNRIWRIHCPTVTPESSRIQMFGPKSRLRIRILEECMHVLCYREEPGQVIGFKFQIATIVSQKKGSEYPRLVILQPHGHLQRVVPKRNEHMNIIKSYFNLNLSSYGARPKPQDIEGSRPLMVNISLTFLLEPWAPFRSCFLSPIIVMATHRDQRDGVKKKEQH
ncbi:hypothetical protein M378DRAFT_337621 [Amanita muscaria Koide BX008]|uniref:Uncharacterized protein n=1 Tax=Amanita muscaria (strain Koide BX008) TaxID=946122 RepID=A0A0C2S654_AMAMK|nr:hypothetical protein M378DRAFT_337621 [Amanita muscaria Koide BX008]